MCSLGGVTLSSKTRGLAGVMKGPRDMSPYFASLTTGRNGMNFSQARVS
jgi:hypothetical protein